MDLSVRHPFSSSNPRTASPSARFTIAIASDECVHNNTSHEARRDELLLCNLGHDGGTDGVIACVRAQMRSCTQVELCDGPNVLWSTDTLTWRVPQINDARARLVPGRHMLYRTE